MAVVLLVEDDIFVRELAEEIIQEFGHQTHSASDMDEALCSYVLVNTSTALVADIRLGTDSLGGPELARQAITLRPQLRVLYKLEVLLTSLLVFLLRLIPLTQVALHVVS